MTSASHPIEPAAVNTKSRNVASGLGHLAAEVTLVTLVGVGFIVKLPFAIGAACIGAAGGVLAGGILCGNLEYWSDGGARMGAVLGAVGGLAFVYGEALLHPAVLAFGANLTVHALRLGNIGKNWNPVEHYKINTSGKGSHVVSFIAGAMQTGLGVVATGLVEAVRGRLPSQRAEPKDAVLAKVSSPALRPVPSRPTGPVTDEDLERFEAYLRRHPV